MCDNSFCPHSPCFILLKDNLKVCSDCMIKMYGSEIKSDAFVTIDKAKL